MHTTRPLALTMGDPAGIGGDITLKAWLGRKQNPVPAFVALDDPGRLQELAYRLGLHVPLVTVSTPQEAQAVFDQTLPVIPVPLAKKAVPGYPDPDHAGAVLDSIRIAVQMTMAGKTCAMVTNPISKKVLREQGFGFPGHTEFLASLAGPDTQAVMMLANESLRVIPVTIHIPLRDVASTLTTEHIVTCGHTAAQSLRQYFAIPSPRLAITGLNPHAGEGGIMGTEEQDIIEPAVQLLRQDGIKASGPLPADTLFHAEARQHYDVVLCMYHDQALIPLKALDFHGGVNVTLGLPFIRTSPDHGTAFALAGTGKARETSLVAALRMASAMAGRSPASAAHLS